mgnify:CR=1 FL=1
MDREESSPDQDGDMESQMDGDSGVDSHLKSEDYGHNAKRANNTETITMKIALFGIMGEYGNNIMVYDTESIMLKHQI